MKWSSVKTKPKILLGMSIPLLLMVALGGISYVSISRISHTTMWVNHTHEVLAKATSILSSAVNMETGMRGYLLAGKEEFLEPYNQGETQIFSQISDLKQTVSDNPAQVARLGQIEEIVREWQEQVTEPLIALRREIGDAKTMNDLSALVGEARGKVYFDKFRGQIATFVGRETTLLAERRQNFDKLLAAPSMDSAKAGGTIAWVTHTYDVLGEAGAALAAAVDMETGMRGYLLAGREQFLEPYNAGRARFFEITKKLRETVSDNPQQVTLLKEVDATISAWLADVVEPMIALRRQIGDAKTMDDMADVVGEARGKLYFDSFRKLMAEFSQEETRLMDLRRMRNAETESMAQTTIVVGVLVAIVLGGGIGWLIGSGIARPIGALTGVMSKLAGGDKTAEIPGLSRGDELGAMAKAVEVFKVNMIRSEELAAREVEEMRKGEARGRRMEAVTSEFDTQVSALLGTVAGAATEMESTATSMALIANDTNTRASSVSTAAAQAASNVQTVATATEELSSSIQEIARQVAQSSQIAGSAVAQAEKTDRQVKGLTLAAQRIGDVVGLISEIAGQTNLLALNATIEAARAGEAGKGFAVVASEVKELAAQTARATEEISQQIGGIQTETSEAVNAIQTIGEIIGEINSIATGISAAMEQQTSATNEIARNVEQAARSTQEVTSNIMEVSRAAGETGASATQFTATAAELSDNSEKLKAQVEHFLLEVRVA